MFDKEVIKIARHDRKQYLQQKCIEMENEGDKSCKKVFWIMRGITGKWCQKQML